MSQKMRGISRRVKDVNDKRLPPEMREGPAIRPQRPPAPPARSLPAIPPRTEAGITGRGGRRVNKIYNTY